MHTVGVELAFIHMPVSQIRCVSLSYLNLTKLSHSDFLCLLDEEVLNIGAITELIII